MLSNKQEEIVRLATILIETRNRLHNELEPKIAYLLSGAREGESFLESSQCFREQIDDVLHKLMNTELKKA